MYKGRTGTSMPSSHMRQYGKIPRTLNTTRDAGTGQVPSPPTSVLRKKSPEPLDLKYIMTAIPIFSH